MTDALNRDKLRRLTQYRRHSPSPPARVVATFADGARAPDTAPAGPIDLHIEATDCDGAIAAWLDDVWWTTVLQRWADDAVTVRVAPTPGALLHPVVLYQIEMIRRVVPAWRAIGHVYRSDVAADDCVSAIASGPYHEVRFIDATRPGESRPRRMNTDLPLEVLFRRIRDEQTRIRATLPVLTRVPSRPLPSPANSAPPLPPSAPPSPNERRDPARAAGSAIR